MFTQNRSFQVKKSFADLITAMQDAAAQKHPLPAVKIEENEGNATFAVTQRLLSSDKLVMSEANGSLRRVSGNITQVELVVDFVAIPGLLFGALQVIAIGVAYVLARGDFDPAFLNFLVILSFAIIGYDRLRYARQFRAQLTAFFGEDWRG